MKREELKELLEIDKEALDEELVRQAKLYEEAGEAAADAQNLLERRELELEELIARTDKDVRATAEAAKEKITEASIKAEISTDREVMELSRKVLDLKHQAKLWAVLERSFSKRADLLTKLVDLHLRTTYGYSIESRVAGSANALTGVVAEKNRKDLSTVRRKRLEDKT